MRYRRLPIALSVTLIQVPTASASQIDPLELSALTGKAEVIVVGHVEGVRRLDDSRDEVTVRIADVLKGKAAGKTVTFPITCRGGLKDFDPVLTAGDKGVFFLRGVEDGKSRLAFFGSVAIFAKGGNFKAASGR
jgi:hypothetical protein